MSSAIPVFEREDNAPEKVVLKERRGVAVVTQYGRALSFGVSEGRTEHFIKSIAQGKGQEVTADMQARKAERLQTEQVDPAPQATLERP
jgi:hypothetical protein